MRRFRQFVLKVHSRCNLACNHCYVYEAADQSWRDQPMSIAPSTVAATGRAIADHARRHDLDSVEIVLHGGEPLMIGPIRMAQVIDGLTAAIQPFTRLELGIQTNGVLLDRRFADLFLAHDVRVGISLDGGRQANDRHRLYSHGGSSYDQVVRAAELLGTPEYRPIFGGLLCTVDVENEPVAVFEDLAALAPPGIDLLLPHATWQHPPPRPGPSAIPYGDWLVTLFDHWFDAPPRVGIRLFQELLNALLGGVSRSEAVGLSAPQSLVIETDGSLEQTDALKVAFPGAAATGYTVIEHSLDDVLADPNAFGSAPALDELSPICRSCPVLASCGGGLYPHRFHPDSGFANPSVYCRDLRRLIDHITHRLQSAGALPPAVAGAAEIALVEQPVPAHPTS